MYRYRITIDPQYRDGQQLPEPKNKKLKHIKIWLNLLQYSLQKLPVATDFKSNLICTEKIPEGWWVTRVKYVHEYDQAPGAVPQMYTLRIEETPPPLSISVLKTFLASTNERAPFEDRELMLQTLNIIFGHHSKSSSAITMIGSNRAYPNYNTATEKFPLTRGLEAIRGYFLSVRLASFRSIVNVNVSHGAFYEPQKMQTLVDEWGAIFNNAEDTYWVALEGFLKDLKVKTQYLKDEKRNQVTQTRTIKSFASPRDGGGNDHPPEVEEFAAPPQEVWFYLDDQRDFRKQKKKHPKNGVIMDKYINVDEFFKTSRSISNPRL